MQQFAEKITPVHLPMQSSEHNHCFGCSHRNPAGLKLELFEAGELIFCDFQMSTLHESYPGVVHGGVTAAVLDEVMGNLLVHREKKVCFTTSLRITYLGTILVGRHYRATARLKDRPEEVTGLYKVQGEVQDESGNVLIISKASFQWMTTSQYCSAIAPGEEPDPALMPFMRQDGMVSV